MGYMKDKFGICLGHVWDTFGTLSGYIHIYVCWDMFGICLGLVRAICLGTREICSGDAWDVFVI